LTCLPYLIYLFDLLRTLHVMMCLPAKPSPSGDCGMNGM
jgi:hypothetical protein